MNLLSLLVFVGGSAWVKASVETLADLFTISPSVLDEARKLATQRHKQAVEQALTNYPTHTVMVDEGSSGKHQFKEYKIDAPGSLPDFPDILSRRVYVTDVFSPEECASVIDMANQHFLKTNGGQWKELKSGQYPVTGFWIKDVPAVYDWFVKTCARRLFPLLTQQFSDFCEDAARLCVDSAYLFRYTPETGRRTDIHTDSGCLSFTIALNEDFEGGGTWIEGIDVDNNILKMKAGQVTVRPGGLKHAGHAVEAGERYIIGGFCMHQEKAEIVRQLLQDPDDMKMLEAAVQINPTFEGSYNLWAAGLEKQGNSEKAIQVLEYCQENVHPFSGSVAYPLGCLHYKNRNIEKVIACMKICLQVDVSDVSAMNLLAEAYELRGPGNEKEQEALYQKIIQTPEANTIDKSVAFTNLGVLHEGKDSEIHFYKKALEQSPERFAPRYSLGGAQASRGKWKEAVESFRLAIQHAETPDQETQALQACYKAAALLLQQSKTQPASREEMLNQFKELMGGENFDKLAARR
jgi:tetratricopeptide (TPR) repeat protein